MRRLAVYISELSLAVFLAAMWYAGFCFCVLVAQPAYVELSPAVPLIIFIVIYTSDRLVQRRSPSMLLYVCMQIVLAAAAAAVLFFTIKAPEGSFGLKAYAGAFAAIFTAVCAATSSSELSAGSLMHRFDICLIVSAVLLLLDHYSPLAPCRNAFAVLLADMILLVISLTMIRSEKNSAMGSRSGRAIPFVLLAVVIILAVLIAMLLAGTAQTITGAVLSAVSWVFGAIGAGLSFLWRSWTRFCAWIASLIPQKEGAPDPIDYYEAPLDLPPEAANEPSAAALMVLYIMTGILILAFLGLIVYKLSKIRLKKRTRRVFSETEIVRCGGGMDEMKKLLSAIGEKISYRINCIRYRNTPAGLLAWCESKAPRAQKRRTGESGPGFLMRLADGKDAEAADALSELSKLVERSFYSREKKSADARLCRAVRSIKL